MNKRGTKRGRNGHDIQWLYLCWSLLIAASGLFVMGVIAAKGCSEITTYTRQHGWSN